MNRHWYCNVTVNSTRLLTITGELQTVIRALADTLKFVDDHGLQRGDRVEVELRLA